MSLLEIYKYTIKKNLSNVSVYISVAENFLQFSVLNRRMLKKCVTEDWWFSFNLHIEIVFK